MSAKTPSPTSKNPIMENFVLSVINNSMIEIPIQNRVVFMASRVKRIP
jgi:hypothetical protein